MSDGLESPIASSCTAPALHTRYSRKTVKVRPSAAKVDSRQSRTHVAKPRHPSVFNEAVCGECSNPEAESRD